MCHSRSSHRVTLQAAAVDLLAPNQRINATKPQRGPSFAEPTDPPTRTPPKGVRSVGATQRFQVDPPGRTRSPPCQRHTHPVDLTTVAVPHTLTHLKFFFS